MMKNILRMLSLALVFCLVAMCCACAEESAGPEPTEEPIIVDELVDVDSLMANSDLDDDGWWNILLLGSDSRNMENYYGLTDSIMILSVHPADNTAKLTSIMRDTWVKIFGVGEGKINAANVYGGPELIMRTVNEHFGMNITQYVLVSMQSLVDIIDQLGGIELNIEKAELAKINQQLEYDAADFTLNNSEELEQFGEETKVNGNQALAFARIRSLDSDYVRTQRQRDVLVAIARQLQEVDGNTLLSVVMTLCSYVETNLSLTQISSLATVGLGIDMEKVEQLRLPADGTFKSDTIDGVWSIRPNFERNTELLHQFIYEGGIIEE